MQSWRSLPAGSNGNRRLLGWTCVLLSAHVKPRKQHETDKLWQQIQMCCPLKLSLQNCEPPVESEIQRSPEELTHWKEPWYSDAQSWDSEISSLLFGAMPDSAGLTTAPLPSSYKDRCQRKMKNHRGQTRPCPSPFVYSGTFPICSTSPLGSHSSQ